MWTQCVGLCLQRWVEDVLGRLKYLRSATSQQQSLGRDLRDSTS